MLYIGWIDTRATLQTSPFHYARLPARRLAEAARQTFPTTRSTKRAQRLQSTTTTRANGHQILTYFKCTLKFNTSSEKILKGILNLISRLRCVLTAASCVMKFNQIVII